MGTTGLDTTTFKPDCSLVVRNILVDAAFIMLDQNCLQGWK